jgi:deazaflavin-dependent oxidoreductase (nitroreductase family)
MGVFGDIKRWMYKGHSPNWIADFLNWVSEVIASLGLTPDYMVTLEVIGRKSGKIISLPVAIAFVEKQRYLVSMLGEDVQWVHNVRAANGKAYVRSGKRREIHLTDIPVDQRAVIIKAYLQIAPGARPHVTVDKDAPLSEFEKVAAQYPVFKLDYVNA